MTQSIYYERPVLLNRDAHRHRHVLPSTSFAFAARTNSLFLAGVEFNEACKEYAIVFTPQPGGRVAPVVMLGLRQGENLYVDPDGGWDARYIPAFVRRYPFVLAQLPGEQMGVCIDEAYAGLADTGGEALFDEQGHNTPFLDSALEFLRRYQEEHLRTEAFCRRLAEAGLLVQMKARANIVDGRSFTLEGMLVVDEDRLAALPDATALSLFRSGEMHLVSMHLLSLSNMQRLVDRMAQRQAPLQPAPTPPVSAG